MKGKKTNTKMINDMVFKDRNEIHLARHIFHILGVGLILAGYLYLPRQTVLLLLFLTMFLIISVDLMRHHIKGLQSFVLHVFGPLMRRQEVHQVTGFSWLLLGNFIIVLLFPIKIVALSLMMLGIADPISQCCGCPIWQG